MRIYIPVAVVATLLLAGCTAAAPEGPPEKLVLVTHDSFTLSDGVLDAFTDETGIAVEVQAAGDAGELVNKLVLTKDSPLGDVVFGIDNTFASRALENGVLADYASPDLTAVGARGLLTQVKDMRSRLDELDEKVKGVGE